MQSRDFTVALDLVRTGKVLQVVADALGPEGFLPRGYPKRGVDRNEWGAGTRGGRAVTGLFA